MESRRLLLWPLYGCNLIDSSESLCSGWNFPPIAQLQFYFLLLRARKRADKATFSRWAASGQLANNCSKFDNFIPIWPQTKKRTGRLRGQSWPLAPCHRAEGESASFALPSPSALFMLLVLSGQLSGGAKSEQETSSSNLATTETAHLLAEIHYELHAS